MAQRPSSARPMTSAGRQPSAAPRSQVQRPPSQAGRPSTAAGRSVAARPSSAMPSNDWADKPSGGQPAYQSVKAPQTAMRRSSVATAAARHGRPDSRMGGGQVPNVRERPVTQQGLAGLRPMTTRGQRQVQDKSFFMGVLRSKIHEITTEISRLNRQIEHDAKESRNLAIYEKKAETLAHEIKDLQGLLADYNTMVDRVNISSGTTDLQDEFQQLKAQNDTEAGVVDQMFAERRQKEEEVKRLEATLEHERHQAEEKMNKIDDSKKRKYEELKEENDRLCDEQQLMQQELDELTTKKSQLEEDLAMSPLKREAIVLHEKLLELEAKRMAITEEMNSEGTPDQQREKLLQKVKQDNQDIGTMDRQAAEVRSKIEDIHEELRELDQEFEDQQGEKNQKYKELKQKEQQMDEFQETFIENRSAEQARIETLEKTITKLLERISKALGRQQATEAQSSAIEEDKSPEGLQRAHQRLQAELQKAEDMEQKMHDERATLSEKIKQLRADTEVYADVDQLRRMAQQKKENLESEKVHLESTVSEAKDRAQALQHEVDELRAKLNENELHLQFVSLQQKWQFFEQSNFVLRETLESKKAESNAGPIKENVLTLVQEYNQQLQMILVKKPLSAGVR